MEGLHKQFCHQVDLVGRHGQRRHEAQDVRPRCIEQQSPAHGRGYDFGGNRPAKLQCQQQPASADLAMAELV